MKTFVIAGTREQAKNWVDDNIRKRQMRGETTLSYSEYVIVDNAIKLRGIQDPHGVFIGTWRERIDIVEVVEALFMACVHVNRELEKIRDDVRKDNITQITAKYTWNEDQAMGILAQEISNTIDQEVIRQVTNRGRP